MPGAWPGIGLCRHAESDHQHICRHQTHTTAPGKDSAAAQGPTDPEQARQARENEFKKRRRSCCFVPLPSFLQPADAKQRAQAPPAEDVDPGAALRRAAASGHQLSQPEHDGTSGYESSASEGDVPSSHKRCAPATGRQPSADRGAAGPLRQRSGSGAVSSGGHASAGVSHAGREVQDGAGEAHDTAKGATGELDFDDPHKDMDIVYRKVGGHRAGMQAICTFFE